MNPYFTVVIPTYNREALIGDTLRSFLAQEYTSFELLVVDDGGSDNTKAVVESFGDSRLKYFHKMNGERGAARNYGANKALGQYVTYFDSDDIVYPWFLSHAWKNLEQLHHPECYAQAFEFNDIVPAQPPAIPKTEEPLIAINSQLEKENILACQGVFVRKDILREYSFSEDRDLSGSEDWVLWLQLSGTYTFHYSRTICSCLINHDQRGELNPNAEKLNKRIQLLIRTVRSDQQIRKHKGFSYKQILAATFLFASLKYADFARFKVKSIGYLFRSAWVNPAIIFRKNTFVTIKKLLFTWYS